MRLAQGKVVLREKRIEDARLDHEWRSDEEIARLDANYPLRMKFEEFLRLYKSQLRFPTLASGRFGIETRDGKYIGNCMFYDLDSVTKQAEIGIVIGDRDYWSRGYGYDAVVALMDYLFMKGQTERLYLHTLDWNKRAQRAFEKCGLTQVTTVRRSGMDFILMEIKKDRWMGIREEKLAPGDSKAPTVTPSPP